MEDAVAHGQRTIFGRLGPPPLPAFVLHTGDLFVSQGAPFCDTTAGGSIKEWDATVQKALQLDFDTVIPGHGAVTDKAGLKTYRDNVEKLRTRVSGLIHEGKTQDDVGKVLTAEYGWQPNSLNMQWSLPGMMRELK